MKELMMLIGVIVVVAIAVWIGMGMPKVIAIF